MTAKALEAPEWVEPLIASLPADPLDRSSLITIEQVVPLVRHHRQTAGDLIDMREAGSLTVQALQGQCRALSFIASRLPLFAGSDGELRLVQGEERDRALETLSEALDHPEQWRGLSAQYLVHRAGMAACFCLTEGWERRGVLA